MSARSARTRMLVLAARLAAGLATLGGQALGQGQDSVTGTQQGHTNPHPVPLLSEIDVTTVPGGTLLDGTTPPVGPRPHAGPGLLGPVALDEPTHLACGAIRDETARTRCAARTEPAAPPR